MAIRLSNLEKALLTAVGADVIKPGTSRKALETAVRGLGRVALTTAPAAPAVARAGVSGLANFARRRPLAAAGLAGVGAYQAGAFDPVEEAIQMEVDRRVNTAQRAIEIAQDPTIQQVTVQKAKRKVSKYSKAVKNAMAAVKKSKFNGKPGKISNAKRTFSTVNKVVSAVNKGKKVAKTGVRGVIAKAARRIL